MAFVPTDKPITLYRLILSSGLESLRDLFGELISVDDDLFFSFLEPNYATKRETYTLLETTYLSFFNLMQRENAYKSIPKLSFSDFRKSDFGQDLGGVFATFITIKDLRKTIDKEMYNSLTYYTSEKVYGLLAWLRNSINEGVRGMANQAYAASAMSNDIDKEYLEFRFKKERDKMTILRNDEAVVFGDVFVRHREKIIPLSHLRDDDIEDIKELYFKVDNCVVQALIESNLITRKTYTEVKGSIDQTIQSPPFLVENLVLSKNFQEIVSSAKTPSDAALAMHACVESHEIIHCAHQNLSSEVISESSFENQEEFNEDELYATVCNHLEPLLISKTIRSRQYRKDLFVFIVYALTEKHFDLTEHSKANLTGIIGAEVGLLKSKDDYLDGDHIKSSYLKYLRGNVQSSVKRFRGYRLPVV